MSSTSLPIISLPQIQSNLVLSVSGQDNEGHLYRWRLGDCLATIAIRFLRPSTDWKILYKLNESLYFKRHNLIQEGDLIKIPQDWLPLRSNHSFDATKIEERNQDYIRESYLLKMYGQLKTSKDTDSNA